MTYLDETTPEELKLAKRRGLLPLGLADWWPIALGLALGGLSPLIYKFLEENGEMAVWAVYPYVVLSNIPQLGLSHLSTLDIPQTMIYAQFPIEGIIAWYAMRRGVGVLGASILLFLIHLAGISALWLMSYTGQMIR
jgi:hypothetical protein